MAASVLLGMAEEVPEALPVAVAESEAPEEAPSVAMEEPEEAPLVAVAESEAPEEAPSVAVAEPEAAADVAVEATDEETQVETEGAWVERPHPKRAVNKTPEIKRLTTGKRAPQSKQPEIESVRSARIEQTFTGLLEILVIMLLQRDRHWD